MIEIENVNICGWEAAIRGMRNPMNSWEKGDSYTCDEKCGECVHGCVADKTHRIGELIIGPNDLKLMKKLIAAGSDHSKFMRMINVTLDITAPLYWWKEFDTYKVSTVRNSCSTMHKIHAKEFTLDDFSHDRLLTIEKLETIIGWLNEYRDLYVNWNSQNRYVDSNGVELNQKDIWWQLIQLLPSSYNQRATIQLNYQVLRNMYHSRCNHKLDEWRKFCATVEQLPYSELITGKDEEE